LVLEVGIEGALGETRVLRDLVDRGLLEAAAGEDPGRRAHQTSPRLRLALLASESCHQPTASEPRSGTLAWGRRKTSPVSSRAGRRDSGHSCREAGLAA